MNRKMTMGERLGIYWPFPRLRYRLRHGYWCEHERRIEGARSVVRSVDEWTLTFPTEPAWEPGDGGRVDGWRMINVGTNQMRRCSACEYAEFR